MPESNNLALYNAVDKICWPLNGGRVADSDNTISDSPKTTRTKFLKSDRLPCFISKAKFSSFKNFFAMYIANTYIFSMYTEACNHDQS